MGVFETSTSSVWIFPPEKPKKVESALLSNKLQKKKKKFWGSKYYTNLNSYTN